MPPSAFPSSLPTPGESYSKTAASVAVFWSVAVPILSFLIGGYIAGRMRSAWETATSDEVQFRDGMHGMLVWALSIVAGGLLAFLAAGRARQLERTRCRRRHEQP